MGINYLYRVSGVQEILVTDFLLKERDFLSKAEDELEAIPMTYDQRVQYLEGILKKGINFGIAKGLFIENERRNRIEHAKNKSLERRVDEVIFFLNDNIHKSQDQPKKKYSKKKYRERKKGIQLNLWAALGFVSDPV